MATVNIDGKDYELKEGDNLLHAVLSKHMDLPYFCWHPAMGSVGSCRLCAVIEYANEEDERGRLQMACMLQVRDGMRVALQADFASQFRTQVIEWLMENHPHDCPVCEEGGECHLQDMTVMTGHSMRRYRGTKRTWENQYLGPFIGHEMNRCITCYRCVRFYRDYAGGTDLEVFGSKDRMFFGRETDGVLENEFAGNLVEVCPTGVFTDKPFSKQYTRKWDLQSAPSVCPGCSVGCNIFASERYGQLKRIHNRYHGDVNRYFLCDRGRFGSHFVNGEDRLNRMGIRVGRGVFEERKRNDVIDTIGGILKSGEVIGIGSPRASVEANYALKNLVTGSNFCIGLSDEELSAMRSVLAIYRARGVKVPTVTEMESADAILILGEDISNTAARMALAVRQAVRGVTLDMAKDAGIPSWQDAGVRGHGQSNKNPLLQLTVAPTRLDDISTVTAHGSPNRIARSAFAIAHGLYSSFADGDSSDFTEQAVELLRTAKRPLIISGTSLANTSVVRAAANIAWALKLRKQDAMLAYVAPEVNTFGVSLIGGGLTLEEALEKMRKGANSIILENDLFRRVKAEDINASRSIVIDTIETPTAENAAVVLPAASYAEQNGTFVNYEPRAQRFYQVFEPASHILPSWRWIEEITRITGRPSVDWEHIDDAVLELNEDTNFNGMASEAPLSSFRVEAHSKVPRQPHRYSGRTAMNAHVSVYEPKTTVDEETPFSFSMEGQNLGYQPGPLIPYVWSPGWNSNQSVFKFQQEVNGHLNGGDGGARLIRGRVAQANHFDKYRGVERVQPIKDGMTPVPLYELFGSDELSAASPPIAERAVEPYVMLNPQDADKLNVKAGDGVAVQEFDASVMVRVDEAIPAGSVGVVQGMKGLPYVLGVGLHLTRDDEFVAGANRAGADVIARG